MNNCTLYIVEAPAVQPGQTVSTGGIRKDGKMVTQFRNPIPLEQHQVGGNSYTVTTNSTRVLPEQANELLKDIAFDVFSALWNDFGYPLLKQQLRGLGQRAINKLCSTQTTVDQLDVIDTEFETIRD